MLRQVYMEIGMAGTLLVGALIMLTAMSWLVALAGLVTRPMSGLRRGSLLALVTVLPITAPVFLGWFVYSARAEMGRLDRKQGPGGHPVAANLKTTPTR